MSASATFTIQATIGGKTIYKSLTKTDDHPNAYVDVPLPVGKAVGAWTKVDADTASGTLTTGHGLVTGKLDCYWTESGVAKQRHNVDATIVADALSLDGGAGDDFPANGNTSVVVTPQVNITVQADGDAASAICVCCEYSVTTETLFSGADFRDTGGTTVKFMHLPPNEPVVWWEYCGFTNPLTGNVIESCKASNGSATNAATLSIMVLEDATP